MPKSDDPIEQARSQFITSTSLATTTSDNMIGLIGKYGTKYLPIIGPALEYFQSKEQKAKQEAFNNLVLDLLADQSKTTQEIIDRVNAGTTIQLIAVATERIFWGASDSKTKRFAA